MALEGFLVLILRVCIYNDFKFRLIVVVFFWVIIALIKFVCNFLKHNYVYFLLKTDLLF